MPHDGIGCNDWKRDYESQKTMFSGLRGYVLSRDASPYCIVCKTPAFPDDLYLLHSYACANSCPHRRVVHKPPSMFPCNTIRSPAPNSHRHSVFSHLNANPRLPPVSPLGIISVPAIHQYMILAQAGKSPHSTQARAHNGTYRIVLPVLSRIHCGMGRFCFCAFASFCFVRKDLWD